MKKRNPINYHHMTREQLVNHCEAYSEALHQLSNRTMRYIRELKRLQQRFDNLDHIRELFQ